jgi:hypothetical protein
VSAASVQNPTPANEVPGKQGGEAKFREEFIQQSEKEAEEALKYIRVLFLETRKTISHLARNSYDALPA